MRTSSLNIFTQVVTDECAGPRQQECFYLATNSGNLRGGCVFSMLGKKAGPLPQLITHELAHVYSIVVSLTDGSGLKPCSWGKWTLGLPVMFRTLNSCFAKITFPQEGSFATKMEKYWQLKNKFKKIFLLSVLKNTLYYLEQVQGERQTLLRDITKGAQSWRS